MLPQLTVYAKIIYLLMVVISGALCTVQDYVIMSQCAHNKAIHLAAEGTVSVTDISQTQNITIVGLPDYINNDFKITLYAKETQRYLCFNENWKLVGMRELQETCYFNETIVHGYFVFRSVIDLQRRVGFTHRGKAIGPKKNVTDACYLFTKIHAEQFFHQHTQFFAPSKPRASAAAPTATTAPASRSNNRPRNKTHGGSSRPNGGRNSGQSSNHSRAGTGTGGPQAANSTSQQHHQVRHHHNDPNVVARRHQHEHKQKRRQRNRIRPSTATAATAAASASPALSPATPAMNAAKPTAAATSALAATKTMHPTATAQTAFRTSAASTRPAQKIAPTPLATSRTTVTSPNTTMATAKATSTATATSTAPVATTTASRKRKGRRRKGDKQHKKHQQRLQQQQQPPVTTANAKDPQHRLAFRAQSTAATYLPSSSTPGEDAESSSVADALSSSSSEFSFLGADWSTSIDPSAPTADRVAFAGPSATTLDADWTSLDFATSVASSAWPTVDPTLATVDSNMLSASTGDGLLFASPSQTSILAEGLNRGTAGLFSLSPDARPTATYDAARAWSEVTTFFDDLETSEQLLAPTPMLATALNTAVGHLPEENLTGEPEAAPTSTDVDSSSSGGGASYETTGGLNDTEATVETTTGDDEMTTWIDDADAGAAWTEPESSSVSTRGDVAATSAALLEREPESSTQLGPATTIFATATTGAGESSSSSTTGSDYSMTEYVFSTRSSNIHNKNRRHRNQSHKNHQSRQQVLANNSGSSSSSSTSRDRVAHVTNGKGVFSPKAGRSKGHGKTTTKASGTHATSATSTAAASEDPLELLFGYRRKPHAPLANSSNTNTERRVGLQKNISNNHHNNSLFDYSGANGSGSGDGISSSFPLEEIMATPTTATSTAATTRRHLRKSTQRLLATPFHQLTYVRNHAGDIDIDNIDNISVYPDLDEDAALEDAAAGDDVLGHSHSQGPIQGSAGGGGVTNSRMTIVSGYLPTSATATLPESIRIAKIKINNERKRMLRQRSAYIGSKA